MTAYHLVFGNDNAESDSLLFDCTVARSSVARKKPILMGRWGTGKSALLLLNNQNLQAELKKIDPAIDRDWLISERALDVRSLHQLRNELSSPNEFKRALEELWRTEIIRVAARVLNHLRGYYGNPSGEHWKTIANVAALEVSKTPIWKSASTLIKALLATKIGTNEARKVENSFQSIADTRVSLDLQRCLIDVADNDLQICVAIEPIETPTSEVESDNSLAQSLITALLNCFRTYFEPSERQRLRVMISIPWHRYDIQHLDLPQKLDQYISRLQWNQSELREFISKRIEWEFARVGNKTKRNAGDAWAQLFPKVVTNTHCEPRIIEDSFSYVLRHTHHRARHLQSLSRKIVDVQAELSNCDVDDVLSGKCAITEESVKKAVRESNKLAIDEILTEAQRRMPDIRQLVSAMLKGISVPFSDEELHRRYRKAQISTMSWLDARQALFTCGIIGKMLTPSSVEAARDLSSILPEENRSSVRLQDSRPVGPRWFWYHYNSDDELSLLVDQLASLSNSTLECVLHPRTFEYIYPGSITRDFPIGV